MALLNCKGDIDIDMKRHILLSFAAASLCIVFLTGCSGLMRIFIEEPIRTYRYTEDYPTLYADELHQIFGDFSISERMDSHIEGESCSCGYHQDEIYYYEWTVTYNDCIGQEMQCVLNNKGSIYEQQIRWLQDQLQTHISTQYLDAYYGDDLRERASYCYCFLGDFFNTISSETLEEDQYRYETGRAYREAVEQREEPIPLSSMSYSELVSSFPMVFSMYLVMDEEAIMSDNEFDSNAGAIVQDLIDEIGDDLNLHVTVQDRERDTMNVLNVLRGDIQDHLDQDLDTLVFDSYIGEYW